MKTFNDTEALAALLQEIQTTVSPVMMEAGWKAVQYATQQAHARGAAPLDGMLSMAVSVYLAMESARQQPELYHSHIVN